MSLLKTKTNANNNGNIDASLVASVHEQQWHEDNHLAKTASRMIDFHELGELGKSCALLLSLLSATLLLMLSASNLSISSVDIFQKSMLVDISY